MAYRYSKYILSFVLLLPASGLLADNMYEYEDENGNLVNGSSVPAHLVHKGFKVYDDRRILIRVVPRQLTAEEQAEARRLAEEEAEKERLRQHDYSLMRRYTSIDDFERKRLAEVEERHARIERNAGRLARIDSDIEAQELRIVPDSPNLSDARRRLDELQSIRRQYQNELTRSEVEAEEYQQSYDYDHQRLSELLENPELDASDESDESDESIGN